MWQLESQHTSIFHFSFHFHYLSLAFDVMGKNVITVKRIKATCVMYLKRENDRSEHLPAVFVVESI